MPEILQTYEVITKGVGRRDFSKAVEYSVETIPTQPLAQHEFQLRGIYTLWTVPFAWVYSAPLGLPSESPAHTYQYPASSIVVSWFSFTAATNFNALIWAGISEYTGAGVYVGQLVGKYAYGAMNVRITSGIVTRETYRYYMDFAVYSSEATFYIALELNGVMSNLTRPWIYA